MQFVREIWHRIGWLAGRSRFRRDLEDEFQFHVESRVEELERGGMARNEALALARREFGSRMKASEDTSKAWQFQWLEELTSDLLYAARAFRRNPGFALTAVFCLALGIGANITIFSLSTSFLFSEPSARDSASLIAIWEGGSSASPVSDYKFVRDAHIFDGMAGIDVEREVNWREGEATKRFYAGVVTDDFFQTLGVPFVLGRGIEPHETNSAVISDRVWRGTFASDPAILGRRMILDGRLYTVAGVLPANYRSVAGFGIAPDVYTPVSHDDDIVQFYARLPKGMSVGTARGLLRRVLEQLDGIHPRDYGKRSNQVVITGVTGFDVLSQQIPGAVTAFFAMLTIVVGLVLLIACTNVASLLLARASSRSHELAIRLSLGASRQRIIRHLLAESLLLSVLGCCAGLAIDIACTNSIQKATLPVPGPIHIVPAQDWRLLVYSVSIALLSALLCGLLPALKATRSDVNRALKQEEHQTGSAWSLRGFLVAGQLAVSIVLLTAAFLFLHNLVRATSMNPGFNTRNTIWAYMRLVPDKYSDPGQTRQTMLVRLALERLRALPGVESAAVARQVPLNDNCVTGTSIRTDISSVPVRVTYECNKVGPDYFRTIGIPILRGREFSAADREGTQTAVIVNASFARAVFGNRSPIGHTIALKLPNETTKVIVGVAKDSKYFVLSEKQRLAMYEPFFGYPEPVNVHFLIRTAGPPTGYVKRIDEMLAGLDSTAVIETKPMSRALDLALLPSRLGALILGTLGLLGLALAAIGLFGSLLYSVSRSTQEIGLRMALGATPSKILRFLGKHSLALPAAGMAAGLVLSCIAMQPLALFLVPGMSTLDPGVFVAAIGVFASVALLAILTPALRALRVDPVIALRYE